MNLSDEIFGDAVGEQLRITNSAEERAKKSGKRTDWTKYLAECRLLHRILALHNELKRASAALST